MNDFLKSGEYINSCLAGKCFYKTSSSSLTFFEEDTNEKNVAKIIRSGTEHKYQLVEQVNEKGRYWMVPAKFEKDLTVYTMFLELANITISKEGPFILPVDVVMRGYKNQALIYNPINKSNFVPIRNYIADPSIKRVLLACELFQRISELHSKNLSLNGFHREQVWVNKQNDKVWICLMDSIYPSKNAYTIEVKQKGFLSIPDALCDRPSNKYRLSTKQRDIFSAAVLAFYLLYFTHPYVGKAYWEQGPEYYLHEYNTNPLYIFDPKAFGINDVGNTDFAQIMKDEWDNTMTELKNQFNTLFLGFSNPLIPLTDDIWDADQWLKLLRAQMYLNRGRRFGQELVRVTNVLDNIKHYRV